MLKRIANFKIEPDYKLRLEYSDGDIVVANFKPLIERGGVFAQLQNPEIFSKVTISEDGRYIVWPEEIDFCADALWLEGEKLENSDGNQLIRQAGS